MNCPICRVRLLEARAEHAQHVVNGTVLCGELCTLMFEEWTNEEGQQKSFKAQGTPSAEASLLVLQ